MQRNSRFGSATAARCEGSDIHARIPLSLIPPHSAYTVLQPMQTQCIGSRVLSVDRESMPWFQICAATDCRIPRVGKT